MSSWPSSSSSCTPSSVSSSLTSSSIPQSVMSCPHLRIIRQTRRRHYFSVVSFVSFVQLKKHTDIFQEGMESKRVYHVIRGRERKKRESFLLLFCYTFRTKRGSDVIIGCRCCSLTSVLSFTRRPRTAVKAQWESRERPKYWGK
jgi:hypothetical protein